MHFIQTNLFFNNPLKMAYFISWNINLLCNSMIMQGIPVISTIYIDMISFTNQAFTLTPFISWECSIFKMKIHFWID